MCSHSCTYLIFILFLSKSWNSCHILDICFWNRFLSMKHRHVKVSAVYVSNAYWISTFAWNLPIHIRHIKIISDFKNPKTYVSNPCPLVESHMYQYPALFQKTIEIACWVLWSIHYLKKQNKKNWHKRNAKPIYSKHDCKDRDYKYFIQSIYLLGWIQILFNIVTLLTSMF